MLFRLLVAVMLFPAAAGCAGYQVGPQGLYPPHVRTVHVPVFQSDSFRYNLAELLTEAVAKEIESRTPYKVVGPEYADTVLLGRILAERKNVLAENLFDEPRELEVNFLVEITWTDRAGNAVVNCATVPVPSLAAQIAATSTFIPEGGQSIATAHQEAIRDLAQEIVYQMQGCW